jgi:hypothetical protein
MTKTLDFAAIAAAAGFEPGPGGRLNLPAEQATADALARAALDLAPWQPGDGPMDVTLTGAGPVWGHLAIAHALHGRARKLTYAAPNAPEGIVVFNHGAPPPAGRWAEYEAQKRQDAESKKIGMRPALG